MRWAAISWAAADVLLNNRAERIRLNDIDCPEKGQAYGNNAKYAASELVYGKEVTVQTHGHDKYKRTIGDVILPDGMNLNQELVKQGWCWWYRKYAPADTVLEGLENEAREGRKGLWADPQPVPPWEWRQLRRSRQSCLTNHLLPHLPARLHALLDSPSPSLPVPADTFLKLPLASRPTSSVTSWVKRCASPSGSFCSTGAV
jgi:micrococcal nuclease